MPSLFHWILERLGIPSARAARPAPRPTLRSVHEREVRTPAEHAPRVDREPADHEPELGRAPAASRAEPAARRRLSNLDEPLEVHLIDWEEELFLDIGRRIQSGRFEVPQIPANHMMAMSLASNPSVEIQKVVEVVTRDPVLSSELLKLANSVVYATSEPVDNLHTAVLRIGMRGLRSLLLSASLKGALLRSRDLDGFAAEVWRQCFAMATVGRAIAQPAGIDPDKAFVIGLLHDIGKVPLLSLMQQGIPRNRRATTPLVGRIFAHYHESAGVAMASSWGLPPEVVSVIGRHHDFHENPDQPRLAAFAKLVHQIDLLLSLEAEPEFRALASGREMEAIGVPQPARFEILAQAERAWTALAAQPAPEIAAAA